MSKPIIAAQLYTVREQMQTPQQIADGLHKIKQIGYSAVQVSGLGPIDVHQLKAILDQEELTVCATHISWDRMINDFAKVVEEHRILQCKYVGLGSMPAEYRGGREGYQRFAQEASELGKRFLEHGLQFIYHNHAFEFAKFDGVTGLDILLAESDPEAFHFELDTYWVQAGGGNPVTWIKKVAQRMKVVHFKDMGGGSENQSIMTEVGEGNLEWSAIIEACQDAGVEYAAVEQDICQRDPFESLAISYQNLINYGLRNRL